MGAVVAASVKERPILFSPAMVRAIVAGAKSQTRRVIKRQPPVHATTIECSWFNPTVIDRRGEERPGPHTFGAWSRYWDWGVRCPYGVVGDRLWVKERHGVTVDNRGGTVIVYSDDASARDLLATDGGEGDLCGVGRWRDRSRCEPVGRWRPAIHMHRWASRLLLEITSLRVERVRAISEADAVAEGVQTLPAPEWYPTWRDTFLHLFFDINERAEPGSDPWVWVVGFKRVEVDKGGIVPGHRHRDD